MDDTNKEEKLIYRLVDDANALVLYLDTQGKINLCNKKVENITGRKKERIIGMPWPEVLYPNDDKGIKQHMLSAVMDNSVAYKRTNNFEGAITDKDNCERIISWSISPIVADSDKLEGILLLGNDITELREQGASLKKIDETIRNIFSNIKEYALYVANLEGNITYYGMGSEIMFGWPKQEIVFKHVSILHTQENIKTKLPFILGQVRQFGKHEEVEINLLRKNGEVFPVILTVTQFVDSEGKLSGYVFIAKDITERKKMEYRILQTEKLVAMGQLVAGMAHEINNPLFVISGRLELLLNQKMLFVKNIKQDLKIINAQADRIRKLVDRLLMFGRSGPLKLEEMDINSAIESVLPFLSYQKLIDAKIEIEKDFARNLPMVKGDLNQLQEVFINLFMNACQAMPEGGKLSIKTSGLANRFVQIQISDTGCGIPKQGLKNIFMPFFSTKKNGSGLGLSICYNVIKNHGGSIEVETIEGKGATFIIKLPNAI